MFVQHPSFVLQRVLQCLVVVLQCTPQCSITIGDLKSHLRLTTFVVDCNTIVATTGEATMIQVTEMPKGLLGTMNMSPRELMYLKRSSPVPRKKPHRPWGSSTCLVIAVRGGGGGEGALTATFSTSWNSSSRSSLMVLSSS